MTIEAQLHNDYLKQVAEVAASQGAAVVAVAVMDGRGSAVVLRDDDDKWRVTSYRAGDSEFGAGYYYSDEDTALREFCGRVVG